MPNKQELRSWGPEHELWLGSYPEARRSDSADHELPHWQPGLRDERLSHLPMRLRHAERAQRTSSDREPCYARQELMQWGMHFLAFRKPLGQRVAVPQRKYQRLYR
ncbi:hypothetical protein [Mumia zhuanghuii]|uniref:Uncharacterized protein n=1 Tax=Mumia zhuanghuii TaxID=2585211 RepID=A0A5C4LS44_9ACTN|nr:hypothetical protein [Mumia zhuanghuii]TNC21771.1 hypothetical protein FHE65_36310 [Mumia zhuanghuii]